MYYPVLTNEDNITIAGLVALTPAAVIKSARPMVPYGILLVILDAVNGITK